MDAVDAIGMALTPGTVFNQQNKVFRSAKALAQFANVEQGEILALVADNLANRVTIRPSAKRPENGPLIALTEYIPAQEEKAVMVKIVAGNAVEIAEGGEVAEVATPEDILAGAVDGIAVEQALDEDEVVALQANDPDDEEVA